MSTSCSIWTGPRMSRRRRTPSRGGGNPLLARVEAERDFYTFEVPFAGEVNLYGEQPTQGRGDQTRYIFDCSAGASLPEPRDVAAMQPPAASQSPAAGLPVPPNRGGLFSTFAQVLLNGRGRPTVGSPEETSSSISDDTSITSDDTSTAGSLDNFGGSLEGSTRAALPGTQTAEMVQPRQEGEAGASCSQRVYSGCSCSRH